MQFHAVLGRHIASRCFRAGRTYRATVMSIAKHGASNKTFQPTCVFRRSISDRQGECCNKIQNCSSRRMHQRATVSNTCSKITADKSRRMVNIEWGDGETSHFPFIFLRDNCACPECYDSSARQRLLLLQDLDLNCQPSVLQFDRGEENVYIQWDDGHESNFSVEWLINHEISEENRGRRSALLGVKPDLWGQEMQHKIPSFNFNELLEDNHALYMWIYTLQKSGLALIKNTPVKHNQLHFIGDRISFLRRNHYGDISTVMMKDQPSTVAYTGSNLACHTDLAYMNNSPGVLMLHCLQHDTEKGGETVLMDGFYAAKLLKENYPLAFEFCTSAHVDHEDIGTDAYKYHMFSRKPIFVLDSEGNVQSMNYTNFSRSIQQNVPLTMIEPMYHALKELDAIIHNAKNHIVHKLQPAEILCMNNMRVMHGRREFKLKLTGGRHLEAAYLDWDELKSRFRVLAKDLELDIASQY